MVRQKCGVLTVDFPPLAGGAADGGAAPTVAAVPAPRRARSGSADSACPICLAETIRHGIETNCGHLFCAQCLFTYRDHGSFVGPMKCALCRQPVRASLRNARDALIRNTKGAFDRCCYCSLLTSFGKKKNTYSNTLKRLKILHCTYNVFLVATFFGTFPTVWTWTAHQLT